LRLGGKDVTVLENEQGSRNIDSSARFFAARKRGCDGFESEQGDSSIDSPARVFEARQRERKYLKSEQGGSNIDSSARFFKTWRGDVTVLRACYVAAVLTAQLASLVLGRGD
jgi:hypothetical protein